MQPPGFKQDGPAGECGDLVDRCYRLRASADATKVGIGRQTAEMMEDCPERTLIPKISPSEMPKKGNLQIAVSAVASVPVLGQLGYVVAPGVASFPLAGRRDLS